MLLESIELYNFRQYKNVKIDFSTDKEKNVTVIIGNNTDGKTTIVQSFIWCLYGQAIFKKELLNLEVYSDLEGRSIGSRKEMYVKLSILSNNKRYIITRSRTYRKTDSGIKKTGDVFEVGYTTPTGSYQVIPETKHSDVIYNILPPELSDYFFFWGERIGTIGTKSHLKTAMDKFFGLEVIANMLSHLNAAKTLYYAKQTQSGSSNLQKAGKILQGFEEKKEIIESEIKEIENNISYYNDKMNEQLGIFEANAAKYEKENKITQLLTLIESNKKTLTEKENEYTKRFNENYLGHITKGIANRVVEVIDSVPEAVAGWQYLRKEAVDEIITRGECVCGQKIESGNEAYNHLIKELDSMPPIFVQSEAKGFKNLIDIITSGSDSYLENMKRIQVDISTKIFENADHEAEYNDLKSEIGESTEGRDAFSKYNGAKQNYEAQLEKRSKKYTELGAVNDSIRRATIAIKDIEKKEKVSEKYTKCVNYTEELIDRLTADYTNTQKQIIKSLNVNVSNYFSRVYHGEREIYIEDDYSIHVYNYVDGQKKEAEMSDGLETVKNFSFIAGLISIAKQQIILNDTEEMLSKEVPPLVLDAPFSAVDEIHVPNICQLLSDVVEQTVMVVMEKDWNFAEEVMKDRVGKYYIIRKKSETYSEVEEQI